MQYSTILVSALAALVSASPLEARLPGDSAACVAATLQVPACARPCIEASGLNLNFTNYTGMCTNFAAVRAGASICVLTACSAADAAAAITGSEAACKVCK